LKTGNVLKKEKNTFRKTYGCILTSIFDITSDMVGAEFSCQA